MEGVTKVGLSRGVEIGIYGLEEIFKEVRRLGMNGDVLKDELLKRVKAQNWVPEGREGEVARAIIEAYKAFCTETQ